MEKLLLTQKLERLGLDSSVPPDVSTWVTILQLVQQFETEYRANEQLLEHSFSEIRELHKKLANKTAKYDKAKSEIGKNATNTCDLHDPVHSVMGLLDTIRKESGSFEHQKELIDMAYSAAESLLDTINSSNPSDQSTHQPHDSEETIAIEKPKFIATKSIPIPSLQPINSGQLVQKISTADTPTKTEQIVKEPTQQIQKKENLSADISRFSGLRVLVIDDVESDTQILKHYLHGWAMEAETASSGGEALKLLFKSRKNRMPYDIIIRDYFMPGKDGLQLFEILSNEPYFKGIPKILLRSQSMFRNEKRHVDFEHSLLKPIQKDALEAVLSECITGKFKRKKTDKTKFSEAI